jgi:hypothetical protein
MEKNNLTKLACLALTAVSACAGPLELSNVARNSKWLLHLDFEAFRKSKIGAHCTDKILQPKIDSEEKIKDLNLSINLKNIQSVTAFGPAYRRDGDGVLLIRTTADVKKDLDTLCGIASVQGGDFMKVTQTAPYLIYSFKDNVFIAPNIENTVIVAKSREQLEHAREVLLGKGESMARNNAFTDYPKVTNTFFFLGMAEGFNEDAAIPPQAQVLKETAGGRLLLGEHQDKVFANLVFKGKNDESSLKIQQVFQGIVALVSLSQDKNELSDIAKSAQIAAQGRNITVSLQIPVSKAVEHLDEHVD